MPRARRDLNPTKSSSSPTPTHIRRNILPCLGKIFSFIFRYKCYVYYSIHIFPGVYQYESLYLPVTVNSIPIPKFQNHFLLNPDSFQGRRLSSLLLPQATKVFLRHSALFYLPLTLSQTTPVFTCLQYKSFENTVGKGEIARNEQFLLFP